MKKMIGIILVFSICGLSGCGAKDTHEQVFEETLNLLDEMVARFSSLDEYASEEEIAQNAIIFVDTICSLNLRWTKLPIPTKASWANMMKLNGERFLSSAVRLNELRRGFKSDNASRTISTVLNIWIFNSTIINQYADSLFTSQTTLKQVKAVHLMVDSSLWKEGDYWITRYPETGIIIKSTDNKFPISLFGTDTVVKQKENDVINGEEPHISIEYGEPTYGLREELMELISPNGIFGKDPGMAELYKKMKEN